MKQMYIYTNIRIYTYTQTYRHTHTHTLMSTHKYIYIYTSIYIYMYIHIYIYIFMYMCIYIYIYMNTCKWFSHKTHLKPKYRQQGNTVKHVHSLHAYIHTQVHGANLLTEGPDRPRRRRQHIVCMSGVHIHQQYHACAFYNIYIYIYIYIYILLCI